MPVLARVPGSVFQRHLEWLLEGPCRGPDGEVAGWTVEDRPVFWYPEIGGYLLTFCAYLSQALSNPKYLAQGLDCLPWLKRSVGADGGVGKDGKNYVFDTAVVARGIHAAALQETALISRMCRFCLGRVRDNRACDTQRPERSWSCRIGPHLLKAAAALHRIDFPEVWNWVSGRLDGHRESGPLYLHAYCYALEGMLLRGGGVGLYGPIFSGAEMLSGAQTAEGGLPSHYPGPGFPLRSDATAQSVRIWLLVDPERYGPNIAKGLDFLKALSLPTGGVRYEPGSASVNVWSTLFTLQATHWFYGKGADSRWLI